MKSLTDIWNHVLAVLGENLTATALNTWFSDCEPIELTTDLMVIQASTDFKKDIIKSRFADAIASTLTDLFSSDIKVLVLTPEEVEEYLERKGTEDNFRIGAGFTFDNFIVGPSNKYAHAASIAVADNLGSLYNPLFFHKSLEDVTLEDYNHLDFLFLNIHVLT